MPSIGLIRERKVPQDERVAFTPKQCRQILEKYPEVSFLVEPSNNRCYKDDEYRTEGITVADDLSQCDILIGVKEVPVDHLMPGKTYLFFSHTKKKQAHNKKLMQALLAKHIRMVDYECLTHRDEQRILGFGFYAGIVGAHNGLLTFGKKTCTFNVAAAHLQPSYADLVNSYGAVKIPNIKIAVTGSGRVASGVLDLLSQLDIEAVEPADYLTHQFDYPVFTHLKGDELYARRDNGMFYRSDFHANPEAYKCLFSSYVMQTDILMNGIYWDAKIARLFEKEDIRRSDWRISVIADITCDIGGSVPINVDATTIEDPVYGIDRATFAVTPPYLNTPDTIDVMAVDNLPNELPRDASGYFGAHMEKFVLPELLKPDSDIINRATICRDGHLTKKFEYLTDYAL